MGLFVLKLAGTPLFAYLTEPLPWSLPKRSVATWNSIDAFNKATYEYLHQLYNSETVSTTRATHFDSTTITNAMRREVVFPADEYPTHYTDDVRPT
ncbi:hypothetical protein AC1031_015013 [Aphanomyces cochlioides]|nr:hypothetical protein AC1031_015013 [Aphanomyces cochlioides]